MPAKTPSANPDEHYIREALQLAQAMLGRTAPNPSVGCVIVRDRRIIGRGATAAGGRPHAETQALAQAGHRARGATAYVSFEPCAHHGQTPPCAQALIDAEVARVVIGCGDPFPKVRGRGIAMLKRAGIDVTVGVLEAESRTLNEGFIKRIITGRPFVTLKLAMTLDGRIAASSGDSRWISSEASRAMVHRWRNESDVVMVGAGTVIADNPRFTCRMECGRDPVRLVIDPNLRSDPSARIFRQRSIAPTLVATSTDKTKAAQSRFGRRVEVLGVPKNDTGIDLDALMRQLAARGWSKVLHEGGAHLAGAALKAGIVDRVAFFIAPKLLGGGLSAIEGLVAPTMRSAIPLNNLAAQKVDTDWLIEAEVHPNKRRPR
ncbi:MAG TPA: bifunctional diaminohydroxyphosphoribosylaminopyrimidine deaminase/5-amino-6-(5-phosphoribosylamino)uracil reductase RibD [Candidatus Binataceae bacterium]|nr:bifunctional diaminohydroxyphosphoribosylaminopyrimidine deaminase/5-amino-6-(5-phosphoribosylamino)uracil reductase RibD [Candidatus Binataceae bacterium]